MAHGGLIALMCAYLLALGFSSLSIWHSWSHINSTVTTCALVLTISEEKQRRAMLCLRSVRDKVVYHNWRCGVILPSGSGVV